MRQGSPANTFKLTAVATGRVFNLADFRARYVLLLFVAPTNARSSREAVIKVRKTYPNFDQVPIAVVVNLRSVPGILRGTVERIMESAFREAAAEIPPGFDPADHLILLPDWEGTVTKAYRAEKSDRDIHMILVDPKGDIDMSLSGISSIDVLVSHMKSLDGLIDQGSDIPYTR